MGAVPTPLAWAEVYPSIQTGVIDGAEAQPSAIWGAKLFEVVSDITVTEHIYLMSGLVVSDAVVQVAAARSTRRSSRKRRCAGARRR